MPHATREGVRLRYETAGEGPPVAFVPDPGVGPWLWAWQQPAVAGPYRTVVWAPRGTGDAGGGEAEGAGTDRPAGTDRATGTDSTGDAGPADGADPGGDADVVEGTAADLAAVLAGAEARRPHLVGAGVGGMVALRYALDAGVRSLTLLGAAGRGAGLAANYRRALADPGDAGAVRSSLSALLSAPFRSAHPEALDRIVEWRVAEDAPPSAVDPAAIEAVDLTDRLHEVTAPALVVHGGADAVVPADRGRALADGLPRGEFVGFEDAGHLVGVERSRPVNDRLVAFLDGVAGEDGPGRG